VKYRIIQLDDIDDAREVHSLAFPEDLWVGDKHQFWVVRNERGEHCGICSALYDPRTESVFLSRAAVIIPARGQGLHQRMIRVRCQWGRRMGARVAVTYTAPQNYESMVALLKSGFRFGVVKGRGDWHYLYKQLTATMTPELLKTAFETL
jgi:hypothetical protein